MTVSSVSNKSAIYATASVGPFAFSFKVFAEGDLDVVKTSTAGVETTLTLTTHYTVSLNADQNTSPGGTVTLVSALVSGEKLVVVRNVDALQETDIQNAGGFYPEVIENALDRETMLAQQNAEKITRSLKIPVSDSSAPSDLPTVANRASKFLAFDASGNPIAASGSGTPATAFWAGVLDDAALAASLASMGFSANIQTLLQAADYAAIRSALSLGTAALVNTGVAAGNVPTVDQTLNATTRAATTTLGTSLNHTLSDTSTTITAFNGVAGVTYHCRCLGAGAITHHATNLIITQTGASIAATAAGDTFDVEMITGTTCRLKNFTKADGTAVVVATTTQPAFAVYLSGSQSINDNSVTKMAFNTEVFDTNTNFDPVTNYRFTPTVEGYYQINISARFSATADDYFQVHIYKNGASLFADEWGAAITEGSSGKLAHVIYMNGSTDYIEFYVYQNNAANTARTLSGAISGGTYASGMKL